MLKRRKFHFRDNQSSPILLRYLGTTKTIVWSELEFGVLRVYEDVKLF